MTRERKNGKREDQNLSYLTRRTVVPVIVASNLITMPEESRKGTNSPINKVTVLSGLGNLDGDNVASSKPSRYCRT